MPDVTPPAQWPPPDRTAPDPHPDPHPWPNPGWAQALARGAVGRCPACGVGHAFRGYLKVVPECAHCGAPLGLVRADDAPPYFTIFLVGHFVVAAMFKLERAYAPSLWLQAAIWLPVTLVLSVVLLRPVKGATLGLMLKLGFLKSSPS